MTFDIDFWGGDPVKDGVVLRYCNVLVVVNYSDILPVQIEGEYE